VETLGTLLQFEPLFLLIGLALIVGYQTLTRRINTKRMLSEKKGTAHYSSVRVQLLLFTLAAALYYLFEVIDHPTQFQDFPQELLLILGGSNIIYLGGKTYSLLSGLKAESDTQTSKKGG
jgi:hypothetical protein